MEQFQVACLNYEICGATTTFADESEYDVYGDEWMKITNVIFITRPQICGGIL